MQGQGSQEHAILLFGGDQVRRCSQHFQKIPLPHVLESLHAPVEYRYILVKVSSNSIETNHQPWVKTTQIWTSWQRVSGQSMDGEKNTGKQPSDSCGIMYQCLFTNVNSQMSTAKKYPLVI